MKTIGVILARGGSKRLPKKNIKPLCGKPLIYYTIKEAKESTLTHVVVSSDDENILQIAEQYETETVNRPAHLAKDDTPSFSALKHAVEHFEKLNQCTYERIVLLQPTSPLRTASMIDRCLGINGDAVITIERVGRNDFKLNGAVFIITRKIMDMIKEPQPLLIDDLQYLQEKYSKNICMLLTNNMVDIDTIEDFKNAEKTLIDEQ